MGLALMPLVGPRLPEELKLQAVSVYKSGYTLDDVGFYFGVSQQSIKLWVDKYAPGAMRHMKPSPETQPKKLRAIALRAQGLTYDKIGDELGCTHAWAYQLVNGVKESKPKKSPIVLPIAHSDFIKPLTREQLMGSR